MRPWFNRTAMIAVALAAFTARAFADEPVLLHAAGSLRAALTDAATSFETATGLKVRPKFGPSGALKDEIAGGAAAEVFASANMEHPLALSQARRSGPVVLFARNRLCAIARPGLNVDTATVLDRMLDPNIKFGTSTPRNDPAGDYAWEIFHKADRLKPGAFAALDRKALQLVGGPSAPEVPAGKSLYGVLLLEGKADMFLTYCTGAIEAEHDGMQTVRLPDMLAVAADYGMTVITGASANAYRLAMFILSADGQRALARYGFAAPNLPQ